MIHPHLARPLSHPYYHHLHRLILTGTNTHALIATMMMTMTMTPTTTMMERHTWFPNDKRRILALQQHNHDYDDDDDYDDLTLLSSSVTGATSSATATGALLPVTSVMLKTSRQTRPPSSSTATIIITTTATTTSSTTQRRRRSRPRCRSPSLPPVSSSSFRSIFVIYIIVGVLSLPNHHNHHRMTLIEAAPDFEPYQLNGGLVTAVAGPNFCITAADTRMIGEGGYLLSSRNHIANRLWTPAEVSTDDHDDDDQQKPTLQLGDDLEDFLRFRERVENLENHSGQNSNRRQQVLVVPCSSSARLSKGTLTSVVIGSSGCSTDCCQLKSDFQADYHAATSFGQMKLSCNTDNVANLLSQTLYGRRTFPYYAFCVVGGLEIQNDGINSSKSTVVTGKAYVYDAIGSYEQVAVASAGTGRELLQPILDRMFSRTATSTTNDQKPTLRSATTQRSSTTNSDPNNNNLIKRQMPRLQVDCTAEEAIDILCQAYRSVSEREIGVGDTLVLHVSEADNNNNNNNDDGRGAVSSRILIVPLKQH